MFAEGIQGAVTLRPELIGVYAELERGLNCSYDLEQTPAIKAYQGACVAAILEHIYRTELRVMYAERWPPKPLVVWLKGGGRYRVNEDGSFQEWK